MEYIYDQMVSNSLNEKAKQQPKLVLQKYNSWLQQYKGIVDKAPQKRTSEEYTDKVVEGTIAKSRGILKNYRRRDRNN